MLNVAPMYHIVDGRQPLDTSKRCITRYLQPPTSSNALRGMRMVRATVRRQFPLAIGATGVLHRAYGGRRRDGIGETHTHGYGKF